MSKTHRPRTNRVEKRKPASKRPPAVSRQIVTILKWLQVAHDDQHLPLDQCYERVRQQILREDLAVDVIALVVPGFIPRALRIVANAVFDSHTARKLLSHIWEPRAFRAILRRLRRVESGP